METPSAKIYLSELCGDGLIDETEPFKDLQRFVNQTLEGGGIMRESIGANSYLVVMPITGDLKFTVTRGDGRSEEKLEVGVGQVMVTVVPSVSNFQLTNPFSDYEVNFIWFTVVTKYPLAPGTSLFDFDLPLGDRLVSLLGATEDRFPFRLYLGQFAGREEALFWQDPGHTGIFCFAVAGAFEVCGRLLHPADGLAIWGAKEVDVEALSNNALMLLVEIP